MMRGRRVALGVSGDSSQRVLLLGLVCALLVLGISAAPAQASRALLNKEQLKFNTDPEKGPIAPPPEGQVEGACGLAISKLGELYVSAYYQRFLHVFDALGFYSSQIPVGTAPEGPCGSAFDSKGALYVNLWHQSVIRLKPSFQVFDEANSTGVAVDVAGNVYVNDRTYVAVYEPSGAPLLDEGQPLKIGLGSLTDAYGLAVFAGRVYVPDAGDGTVKVYEPAGDPLTPVLTINGSGTPQSGFNSLVDASLAVDLTTGNVLVIDNLQPGFEHPKGAIDEFDAFGNFLGQLKTTVVHGGPSGIAVAPTGELFVTSGNSENSNVFAFGGYVPGGPEAVGGVPEVGVEAPASQGGLAAGAAGVSVSDAVVAGPAAPTAPNQAARKRRPRRPGNRKAKHRHSQRRQSGAMRR